MAKTTNNHKQNFTPLDTKPQTGFTIIEVVLVLAIAGLIFLIVFLALPGLQKSRRDTQRKSDVGRMIAAIISYQSNTGELPKGKLGAVPFASKSCNPDVTCIIQSSDKFTDPSGHVYGQISSLGEEIGDLPKIGDIVYFRDAKCNESTSTTTWFGTYLTSNAGTAAILMPLEAGGYYCRDTGA